MAPKTKIHDLEVDQLVVDSVSIDDLQINEEYKRIPTDLAYWNTRYAKALRSHLLAKLTLDQTEARLRIVHRADLETRTSRVTESMVEAAVMEDSEYTDAKMGTISTEADLAFCKGIAAATAAKKDVLQSLGAQIRAEIGSDLVLREQAAFARKQRSVED